MKYLILITMLVSNWALAADWINSQSCPEDQGKKVYSSKALCERMEPPVGGNPAVCVVVEALDNQCKREYDQRRADRAAKKEAGRNIVETDVLWNSASLQQKIEALRDTIRAL